MDGNWTRWCGHPRILDPMGAGADANFDPQVHPHPHPKCAGAGLGFHLRVNPHPHHIYKPSPIQHYLSYKYMETLAHSNCCAAGLWFVAAETFKLMDYCFVASWNQLLVCLNYESVYFYSISCQIRGHPKPAQNPVGAGAKIHPRVCRGRVFPGPAGFSTGGVFAAPTPESAVAIPT